MKNEARDGVINRQTRLVNQLIACLKAPYPVALALLTRVRPPRTLAVKPTYPTVETARHASMADLTQRLTSSTIRRLSYGRRRCGSDFTSYRPKRLLTAPRHASCSPWPVSSGRSSSGSSTTTTRLHGLP